jgi:hypothetical protein
VIRLLQAKLKRKHDVAVNIGDDQTAGIKIGAGQMYPDVVLTSQDKNHRLEGVIEVETGESVNHLEAMAQWAHFGRVRAPFHLYVPASAVDIARRLCAENAVTVSEIWSYHSLGDQTRFTLVSKAADKPSAPEPARPKAKPAASRNGAGKAAAKPRQAPAARPKTKKAAAPKNANGKKKRK